MAFADILNLKIGVTIPMQQNLARSFPTSTSTMPFFHAPTA
jgi:hypothetical protein